MPQHEYADWKVKIDDETIKASDGMEVSTIVVDLDIDRIDTATIEFANVARGVLSGRRHKIGDSMQIEFGYDGTTEKVFLGECVGLEPRWPEGAPSSLLVRGMDRLHRLKRGTGIRVWENKKDSDVVKQIASECGLQAQVDATSETHKYILQNNVGNGEFIKFLARRNHYDVDIDDSKLKFIKPPAGSGGAIDLTYELDLQDCRMKLNAVGQVSEVVVRAWDYFQKKEVVGKAKTGDVSKGAGTNLGADLAKSAFGDSTAYVTDFPVANQGEANALAKSIISAKAGQFLSGTARCMGDPKILPGSTVNLKLLGDYSGKYTVTSARHMVSSKGYIVDFDFSSNTDGEGE
jgi:phage protein D